MERLRAPMILANPDYASNPFQTIRTHARNTLLKHELPAPWDATYLGYKPTIYISSASLPRYVHRNTRDRHLRYHNEAITRGCRLHHAMCTRITSHVEHVDNFRYHSIIIDLCGTYIVPSRVKYILKSDAGTQQREKALSMYVDVERMWLVAERRRYM